MANLPVLNDVNLKLSNWDKPGGKLGMVVAGLLGAGGLVALYKLLPFLITMASNLITLAIMLAILALIIFLVTDKKVRMLASTAYFMAMRAITGAFVEIDPIAIVERRLIDMKKKIGEISKAMGDILGYNRESERKLNDRISQFEREARMAEEYRLQGNEAAAIVSLNQVERLDQVIRDHKQRLEDSKRWYSMLKELEQRAKLTVLDTENAITIRKETFEEIKKQHKAFKSMMSIMSGDPDELAMFNQAMDFMANDITKKLGEMEHVLDSTTGLMAQFSAEKGVIAKSATDILERYNKYGINGLFDTAQASQTQALPNASINLPLNFTKIPEPEKRTGKYFPNNN